MATLYRKPRSTASTIEITDIRSSIRTTDSAVQLIECSMLIRFQSTVTSLCCSCVHSCYRHRGRRFCAARFLGTAKHWFYGKNSGKSKVSEEIQKKWRCQSGDACELTNGLRPRQWRSWYDR